MKKTLSWLIVLAMLIGMMPAVFATEATQTAGFVASALGYENGTAVENIEGEVISFAFSDGGNSYGNCPKYYNTGTAIRFYSQNSLTISVAEGYKIVSVTVTTDSSKPMNADNTALTNATAEYTDASTVLTPVDGTQSVVMAYTPSSGHWRVQAVDVVYEEVASDEPIEVENPIVIGDNEIELPRLSTEAAVYNYVATETGTLYVAITGYKYSASWTGGAYEDEYDMYDFENGTTFTVNGEALSGIYYGAVEVVAGEVYTFSWSLNEDCTYGFLATLNLSWTDENIPAVGIDIPLTRADLPMNTVEIPAGEQVTYLVSAFDFEGYLLTITGENFYVTYQQYNPGSWELEDVTLEPVDGVVELDVGTKYIQEFQIGNSGTEAVSVVLDCYAPLGGIGNPIIVDTLDEVEVTIPAQHEGYTYFKWIATEVGTVWITPGNYYVNFENLTTGEYGDYDDTMENYFIYVMPGDELLIAITGWFEEDTFYDFPYWFEAGYRAGSEQNPIEINLMDPLELNLYNETIYYTWTPDQSMIVTLGFTFKYTWSSNVPTILINGEEYTLDTELTVTAGEPVTMVLSTEPSVYGTLQATLVEVIEDEPIEVENPIVIGDNEIELPMGSTEPSVYNFVATETGTLYISAIEFLYMASWTEGQYVDNSQYMEDWTNNTIFTVNGEELSGGFYGSVEVVAGEVYTFSWSLQEHCTWGFKATINLSYSDEHMPVPGVDMVLMPSDLPMNTVEIPAGGEQLYKFSYEFNGYVITITGENAYVTFQSFNYEIWDYETVRIDAVDGVVKYDMGIYGMSEIYIGNAGTEAATFALDYYAPVGGEKNPIIVENLEDIFVSADTGLYNNVYFQWTSDKLGTIVVDTSVVNINFYNVTKDEVGEYESDWVTYKVYVEPGDVLNICVSLSQEADYSFTYEFFEGYRLGTELNPYPVDLLEGLYVDLYGETVYYTWTPAEDMTVTLDFTLEYDYNERVPVIVVNGETYTLGSELTVTAGEPVLFTLSAPDGSVYGTLKANEVTGEDPNPEPDPGFEMPENGEVLAEETVNVPASWMGITKTFEMTADGTLYVVLDDYPEECSVEYAFYVSGNTKNYYWTHSNGAVQSMEVLNGDTVKLELCVLGDNGNGAYVGGDVSYRLVFVPADSGEEPVDPDNGILYEGTITTTDENAFWGEVINLVAPADGHITVTFVYTDIYPEYQVNIADVWGEWFNVLNGGADTMSYEVREGEAIQISVATQDAAGEYVGGSVEVIVTFVAGEVGGDVEIDTVLELGENIINIAAGETLSYQYTFVPETDGMLDLSLLTLKYTYGGMTEDVTAFLADYLAEGVIALQVNGYDYTEPVAVTAGEEVIITMTQSRMYSNYGYAWEATLNITVTPDGGEEVLAGDANGDGSVDFLDAILVLQYYTEEEAAGIDMAAADANGDGMVDFLDAILILQIYVDSE